MKVLLINHTCGIGSTGRICAELALQYVKDGHEAVVAYGRGEVPEKYRDVAHRFGSDMNLYLHALYTRMTDRHGFASRKATAEFLKWADAYDPDLLWLHNIHGYYINIEMLFDWIKSRPDMEVKWTLHDCWAFTGHCSHFSMVNCGQWKTHCEHCMQKKEYPASALMDNCHQNFERKKAAFTGVKKMTLITPSQWLADLVKQSFLKEYPVEVHYNTIDTNVFKPTPSDFRQKYGLQDKIIILGVANVWHERKGFNDFMQLAKMLDERYVIVLVGLTQKQIDTLPKNVVGIRRVNSLQEPVAMYTMANVYANPSKEENFGMMTPEATASGANAIAYPNTACEEVVKTQGGIAIPQSVECLYEAITGQKYKPTRVATDCLVLLLSRTSSAKELAQIYTAADFFCNPTHEDNYPTTNLEAQACGTWVITYDVGGSKETLH